MRTSPPRLLTANRSSRLPGTRSMSPNEQKITPGFAAMASALSIISSGVTHTGQPGPWISSICSGSSWSMPLRMIECVWPPQTSINAHGRVTVRLPRAGDRAPDLVKQALGDLGITEFVEVLHPATGAPPCESAFNSSFSTSSC